MTEDSVTTAPVPASDLPTPVVKELRQNPKWVGLVMAFFLPGSAHFLSGQYRLGVVIYFVWVQLSILLGFLIISPGIGFFFAVGLLVVVHPLFYIAVFISSWRHTRRIGCLGWILFLGAVLLFNYAPKASGVLSWKTYGEVFGMNGQAMAPTLIGCSDLDTMEIQSKQYLERIRAKQHLERIIVNNWIYRVSDPKRGDVIVHKVMTHDGSSTNWTQRIVGLPGETVDIEPPYVLINGKRLTEPPIFAKIASKQDGFVGYCTVEDINASSDVSLPMTLGADEYFVLGDNSPYSRDSRFDGPVLRRNITGKVIRICYPLNRIREIE
jgi:signal peptidase I